MIITTTIIPQNIMIMIIITITTTYPANGLCAGGAGGGAW
jgi:hypothetical protein